MGKLDRAQPELFSLIPALERRANRMERKFPSRDVQLLLSLLLSGTKATSQFIKTHPVFSGAMLVAAGFAIATSPQWRKS